jgi:hypothetical protein
VLFRSKKEKQLDLWMISRVSAFLGQGIDTEMNDLVSWMMNDGSQVSIRFNERELKFIDWVGDDKTYYSLVGVASMSGFTTEDYFTI